MKLASKIAASLALLGAITTARAESITFGVEIPPLASLIVRDGVIRGVKGLQAAPATVAKNAPTVGGFTVVTNMPKWNLYFSLANDGNLVDASGNYLKAGSPANYLPLSTAEGLVSAGKLSGNVLLQFPTANEINGTDGAATALVISATAATMSTAVGDGTVSNTVNTLTAALAASSLHSCTSAACADNAWVFGTSQTVANFGVGAWIDNTDVVASLAGQYTETMYVTLLTSY